MITIRGEKVKENKSKNTNQEAKMQFQARILFQRRNKTAVCSKIEGLKKLNFGRSIKDTIAEERQSTHF